MYLTNVPKENYNIVIDVIILEKINKPLERDC